MRASRLHLILVAVSLIGSNAADASSMFITCKPQETRTYQGAKIDNLTGFSLNGRIHLSAGGFGLSSKRGVRPTSHNFGHVVFSAAPARDRAFSGYATYTSIPYRGDAGTYIFGKMGSAFDFSKPDQFIGRLKTSDQLDIVDLLCTTQ